MKMRTNAHENGSRSIPEDRWISRGGNGTGTLGISHVAHELGHATHHGIKLASADAENMRRMGRNQELIRNFRMFSVAALATIATAVWEFGIFQLSPALIDGGSPELLYSTIWNFIGFGPIYLSIAEMASMAPTAGCQYHWVSEFAPDSMQKVLSYICGWTSNLALQAGNALGALLVGIIMQVLIVVHDAAYSKSAWHAALLVVVGISITYSGNILGYRALPVCHNVAFAIHVLAYFAIIVAICVNAPKASSEQVWTGFENTGGWSSVPLAVLIGQLPGICDQVGIDTAAHMAEEVRDAALAIPRAILIVYVTNFIFMFPMLLTFLYHMPDPAAALDDDTTYPAMYVLRQSMSTSWLTGLLLVIIALLVCSNITFLTATSRALFAFARDNGLPYSIWISSIDRKRRVPQNAAMLTCVLSTALTLIYIGSHVAFYAITSLFTVAIIQSYCLSIGCVLWRRIYHPETLPYAQFSLGRFGIMINSMAVIYGIWCFFWSLWPQQYPVTASGFNWASVMYGATLAAALLHYAFVGRHKYQGPVSLVEERKLLSASF